MKPILSSAELITLINQPQLVIVDARSGPGARGRYEEAHLPGAIFADLETDLSAKKPDASDGGRHPLPSVQSFGAFLEKNGISPETHIIAYDDKSGANAAARFWWMMRAIGHEKIQVLDGGFPAAIKAGIPTDQQIPAPVKTVYPVIEWTLPLSDINNVARAATNPHQTVIDVREAYRYRGESEPIDLVAGHIPGAINLPYTGNLDAEGNFRSPEDLKIYYQSALNGTETESVIVHCGSGVTACHTLLAMEHAGLPGASLYVGSWSEWSRNDREIATEL